MKIVAYIVVSALFGISIVSPLVTSQGSAMVVAALSAALAVIGWSGRVLQISALSLLLFEIVYGYPVGVLSVGWGIVVLIVRGISQFVQIRPWNTKDGWRMLDALMALLISLGAYHGTLIMSALLLSFAGMANHLGARMLDAFSFHHVRIFIYSAVPMIVALRRLQAPFFRTIHFGV